MTRNPKDNAVTDGCSVDGTNRCVPGDLPAFRVVHGDITQLDTEGFLFYTGPDLQLGSGLGGMIRRRGGAEIQKQLNELAPRTVAEAVLTSGGKLDIEFIVHIVGPGPGEPEAEAKLMRAVLNGLLLCEERQAKRVAVPTVGTGFYGVPVETSASAMVAAFKAFFKEKRHLAEIVICCRDAWTVPAVENHLKTRMHSEARP